MKSYEPKPENAPLQKPLKVPKKLAPVAHKLRGHKGHPARQNRDDKRRQWFTPKNQREVEIRERNRLAREILAASPEDDGLIAGNVAVVARDAAQQHAQRLEIEDPETIAMMTEWFKSVVGEAVRHFDQKACKAWRDETLERVTA